MGKANSVDKFFSDDFIETPTTPEKALLARMLERALLDLHSEDDAARLSANIWFFGEQHPQEPFSLAWTCEHLGLCSIGMRGRARAFRADFIETLG